MDIFVKNTVVRLSAVEMPRRILHVSIERDFLVSISLHGRRCSPTLARYSDWMSMLTDGTLEIIDEPNLNLPFDHALTDSMRSRKAKAWAAIEPLIRDIPAIFQSRFRNQKIKLRAEEMKCHVDSIRDWLNEYWQLGCTPSALFGKRKNCGAPGKLKQIKVKLNTNDESHKNEEVKRGTPRSTSLGIGINISEDHRRAIRISTNLFYKRNKKATLRHAYLKMIRHYYPHNTRINEKGRIEIIHPDGIPTYQQFIYWFKKDNSEYEVIKSREGKTFFEKTLRPLLGNCTFEAIGPGYRYQIDATIADVYLVSRIDRNTIVGRPVIYVVIDVWSRLIVGVYIGLENASWATAMMAIHNVTLNKVAYCKQFGIDIETEEWPDTPLSSVILGDRGELLSKQADRLAEMLYIDVENTAPYRADWKGLVERQFRLLPAKFAADVKGYVDKDFGQRTGPDYRLDACLNLHDFTKIAIHCVLEHNSTPVGGYPLENAMVAQQVLPIPTELWAWGIKNRMGTLVRHSEYKLLFALLPTANASVTSKGISFLNRNYYASVLDTRAWFSRARSKGRFKVVISYHPHNLDIILLHDPVYRDQFTCCTLISNDRSDLALYVEEVVARTAKAAKTNARSSYDTISKQMTHQKAIEDIAASANAEKEDLGPSQRSKKERISNIRSYRQLEKILFRLIDRNSSVAAVPHLSGESISLPPMLPAPKLYARTPIFFDDGKGDE